MVAKRPRKPMERRRTTAELRRLYEDLWIALGPVRATDRAGIEHAFERMRRIAEGVRIRKIMDPLEAKVWSGGSEASKRYQTYDDGQTVADWILKHGDGGHLRLDVQRGCIRLVSARKRANPDPLKS
jgi:hypothetical protein